MASDDNRIESQPPKGLSTAETVQLILELVKIFAIPNTVWQVTVKATNSPSSDLAKSEDGQ